MNGSLPLDGESSPPSPVGQRLIDVLVDETPAHFGELRCAVAMHHVNVPGAVVTQQGCPFVGALPAADDHDPGTGE